MQADNELEAWRREWQAESAVPLELRGRVERDIRHRRLSFAASVAVTILIGGGTTLWAAVSGESEAIVLAGVWVFIVINWVTSVQLDRKRGPSKPMADTTATFLDFSIRSCRARRQGITASAALYAGFSVFMLAWKYRELAKVMPLELWTYLMSGHMITFGTISAALAVLAVYQRQRLGREIHNLVILRQQLGPDASSEA